MVKRIAQNIRYANKVRITVVGFAAVAASFVPALPAHAADATSGQCHKVNVYDSALAPGQSDLGPGVVKNGVLQANGPFAGNEACNKVSK